MEINEHSILPSLAIVCAECGDELVFSPSGHQLCANRLCRDGFDVRTVSQFAARRCS